MSWLRRPKKVEDVASQAVVDTVVDVVSETPATGDSEPAGPAVSGNAAGEDEGKGGVVPAPSPDAAVSPAVTVPDAVE